MSVGSLIALVVLVSLSIYCVIKMRRRSAASSARNECRGNCNPMEQLDIITMDKSKSLSWLKMKVWFTNKSNIIVCMRSRPMSRMVLCNTTNHAMGILKKSSQQLMLQWKNYSFHYFNYDFF